MNLTFACRASAAVFLISCFATAQCPPPGGYRGSGPGAFPIDPPPPPYNGPGDTSPSGPSSPGPSGPSAPGPNGPNTPRGRAARGPVTPSGGVGAGPTTPQPRGAAITFEHRGTALENLRVDWDYPSFAGKTEGSTVAPRVYHALPVADALRALAGDDRRPLLLLRECFACQGTEGALINTKDANEKTLLFARWFHCVRLDDSLRHESHPAHLLFKENSMPHLLLCQADGSTMTPLDGKRPQSALWGAMRKVLREAYTKDPDVAVRDLFKVLSEHDHIDSLEAELSARLQTALEQHPKASSAVRDLEAQIARLGEQRDALKKKEAEIMDLGLKAPEKLAASVR